MTMKKDKRLCWNCEGDVSYQISQCPYCGVDVTQPQAKDENAIFKGYATPFQAAAHQEIPQPPYAQTQSKEIVMETVSLEGESEPHKESAPASNRDLKALLLLLPGIVFSLFGLTLLCFSTDGVLTLQWNQNVAIFYFLGAAPLLYLGWRSFRS